MINAVLLLLWTPPTNKIMMAQYVQGPQLDPELMSCVHFLPVLLVFMEVWKHFIHVPYSPLTNRLSWVDTVVHMCTRLYRWYPPVIWCWGVGKAVACEFYLRWRCEKSLHAKFLFPTLGKNGMWSNFGERLHINYFRCLFLTKTDEPHIFPPNSPPFKWRWEKKT